MICRDGSDPVTVTNKNGNLTVKGLVMIRAFGGYIREHFKLFRMLAGSQAIFNDHLKAGIHKKVGYLSEPGLSFKLSYFIINKISLA